jgi:hypothetical protein
MRRVVVACVLAGWSGGGAARAAGARASQAKDALPKLIAGIDAALGHRPEGLAYEARVTCPDLANGTVFEATYDVRSRAESYVAMAKAPEAVRGEALLVKGRMIWRKRARAPEADAVTLSARRSGVAVIADIMATRLVDDYDAKDAGSDKLDGRAARKITLHAKGPTATYEDGVLWADDATRTALRLDLLLPGGAIAKRVTFAYAHELAAGGGKGPFLSRVDVVEGDAAPGAKPCSAELSTPKAVEVPSEAFELEKLGK